MMTNAYLDRLAVMRQLEARLTDIELAAAERVYWHLAAADAKVARLVNKFIAKWTNTRWDKIPQSAITELVDETRKAVSGYAPAQFDAIKQTANAQLAASGEAVKRLGLQPGQYNVNKSYLRLKNEYIVRLSDAETRVATDQIQNILERSWMSGAADAVNVVKEVRAVIGCDKSIAKAYTEALKLTKGMTEKARRAFLVPKKPRGIDRAEWLKTLNPIQRQLVRLRGLANKAARVARSEQAITRGEVYEDWRRKLEGVIGERFVAESTACDLCQSLEGVYPEGQAPKPVIDTHPNCNCHVAPLFEGVDDVSEMREGVERPDASSVVGEKMAAIQVAR